MPRVRIRISGDYTTNLTDDSLRWLTRNREEIETMQNGAKFEIGLHTMIFMPIRGALESPKVESEKLTEDA